MKRREARAPASQGEVAYWKLVELILDDGLQRGLPLNERSLASLTGVSRTPVREAITRLVARGILTKNGAGVMAADRVDIQRYAEISSIRRLVEGEAAALAVSQAQKEAFRAYVEEVLDKQEPAATGYVAWMSDSEFHARIDELAGNRFAANMMSDFRLLSHVIAGRLLRDRKEGAAEHRRIAAAILEGDAVQAKQAMEAHITAERDAVLEAIIAS